MLGSAFVEQYGRKGLPAWEAAAIALARENKLTPWPFVDLVLTEGGDTAVLKVASDMLSVGPFEDYVRLPLTPQTAQSIANLSGALLVTPWLEYQIWRAAKRQLPPTAMVPNQGANLEQYAAHSKIIDDMIKRAEGTQTVTPGLLTSGIKKDVVVANFYKPGKVLIWGWRRPPPAPDVFDDGKPMGDLTRQPIQPKSNVHGDFYVDYSHGIRLVGPTAIVNGQPMDTASLYTHPTLWRLVNRDAGGPIKLPRYPSSVPVANVNRPASSGPLGPAAIDEVYRPPADNGEHDAPHTPSISEHALDMIAKQRRGEED